MDLDSEATSLLIKIANDPDGLLRTKARPDGVVRALINSSYIEPVLTSLVGGTGAGGVSIWRITKRGKVAAKAEGKKS